MLHDPRLPQPGRVSLHDTVGVLQLVFASVAGVGALVALVAYRRQKVAEADSAHDRVRVFNERFTATAAQLGDARSAVRLAGVHAMAGLADDWMANRQTCIDVLCAYLRMPYEPDPGEQASATGGLAFRANREVRHTVIRVIAAHLRPGAVVSWRPYNFDSTGAVFDGGNLEEVTFAGVVSLGSVQFSDGRVSLGSARFTGGAVSFDGATCSGTVSFGLTLFTAGLVSFGSRFTGSLVRFDGAEFLGAEVSFARADFSGGTVDLSGAVDWSHPPDFGQTPPPENVVRLPVAAVRSPDTATPTD